MEKLDDEALEQVTGGAVISDDDWQVGMWCRGVLKAALPAKPDAMPQALYKVTGLERSKLQVRAYYFYLEAYGGGYAFSMKGKTDKWSAVPVPEPDWAAELPPGV